MKYLISLLGGRSYSNISEKWKNLCNYQIKYVYIYIYIYSIFGGYNVTLEQYYSYCFWSAAVNITKFEIEPYQKIHY